MHIIRNSKILWIHIGEVNAGYNEEVIPNHEMSIAGLGNTVLYYCWQSRNTHKSFSAKGKVRMSLKTTKTQQNVVTLQSTSEMKQLQTALWIIVENLFHLLWQRHLLTINWWACHLIDICFQKNNVLSFIQQATQICLLCQYWLQNEDQHSIPGVPYLADLDRIFNCLFIPSINDPSTEYLHN